MGKSKIEWTDRVWNPITGCTKISPGCANCYAERMSKRLAGRCGYDKDEPFKVTLHRDRLHEPMRWTKPSKVFVCSMSDLFHDDVPFSFLDELFGVMVAARKHTFLVLTKRPERMYEYMMTCQRGADDTGYKFPWEHIWLGVTAENQEQADKRIPVLLQIPAAVRFVSVEPMLGPVDMTRAMYGPDPEGMSWFGFTDGIGYEAGIQWVICGGESGPGARPMHPDWARGLRDQCLTAGVPYFFKQWGQYCYPEQMTRDTYQQVDMGHNLAGNSDYNKPWSVGKKAAGRLLDGREWNEMPGVE